MGLWIAKVGLYRLGIGGAVCNCLSQILLYWTLIVEFQILKFKA